MAARSYREYKKRWSRAYRDAYLAGVLIEAARIKSDGCSGIPDFYYTICLEHDIHYAYHWDFFTSGDPILQEDADLYLKWGIWAHSWFGRWSPMAWWRYKALSWKHGLGLGTKSWDTGPRRLQERLKGAIERV